MRLQIPVVEVDGKLHRTRAVAGEAEQDVVAWPAAPESRRGRPLGGDRHSAPQFIGQPVDAIFSVLVPQLSKAEHEAFIGRITGTENRLLMFAFERGPTARQHRRAVRLRVGDDGTALFDQTDFARGANHWRG